MTTHKKNEMLGESMAGTTTMAQYADLNDFLIKHKSKDTTTITHTRIGNTALGIYGGAYCIPPEELPIFYKLYCTHVFVNNRKEYLTEKQLTEHCPLLIDFDFRYDFSVEQRLHTEEHITDIVQLYLEEIKKLMQITENATIPVYVFEKPEVNRMQDKQITKDGIHIVFGIQMDRPVQIMLRNEVIKQIPDVIDLPLQNTWETIIDDGICKGCTNWQVFGSQKPNNQRYNLTHYFEASMESNQEWCIQKQELPNILTEFPKFSAQYPNHPSFELFPYVQEEIKKSKEKPKVADDKKKTTKKPANLICYDDDINTPFDLDQIVPTLTSHEALEVAVNNMLASIKSESEFYIRETHEYTQILPEAYYMPGSHNLNTKVAFALKHTDERLFVSWIMLRAKAEDFSFDDVPNQYKRWKNDFNPKQDGKQITRGSIMYWANNDAPEEFERIRQTSLDHLVIQSLFNTAEWDHAKVLNYLFKGKYVSSGNSKHPTWLMFKQHRWQEDKGSRLRCAISTDLFNVYYKKQTEIMALRKTGTLTEDENDKLTKQLDAITKLIIKFKTTSHKNNIMREAADIFFDDGFEEAADANPYLLCFTNGVFDFKTKQFRAGTPHDYITKTTGNPYYTKEELETNHKETMNEINEFMAKLFPVEGLRKYMWDHLASSLIGDKKEHALNIYKGSGANGKSILADLMSHAIKDYFVIVPITLICSDRTKLGSATPEVMQLKAARYAISQEPSKNMILNDGIMKELTCGDMLTGRALYGNTITFKPQFTMAVCTNWRLGVNSDDDGTWRRMKEVTFMSKFVSPDEKYTDTTQYVYPKDKNLKAKLPVWAPVFVSMLVHRACETDGEVVDCPEVTAASQNYRQSQDSLNSFIVDRLEPCENEFGVSQQSLNAAFKEWFQVNVGQQRQPKVTELQEAVNRKFGSRHPKKNKWFTFKIREDVDDDDDMAVTK